MWVKAKLSKINLGEGVCTYGAEAQHLLPGLGEEDSHPFEISK